MSILEDMDGKAIIWANYQRDIENIVDEISENMVRGPWLIIMD